ncbi:MAG TPA: glucoamylase [Kribbella sp.]
MRDDSARRIGLYPVVVIVLLLAVLAAGTTSNLHRNHQPELVAEGIPGRQVPTATTAAIPAAFPDLVRQALADLDALTLPTGAALAGWNGPWRFVWPRDASFVAAARCSVGQYAEADQVLGFLNKIHPVSGRWAARYLADSGSVPQDGRGAQLDGSGWILWSTWFCAASRPDVAAALVGLRTYWPMLRESGDHIVAELDPDGLPAPSPDYWERDESQVTLGTIAPLLAGLRAGLAMAALLDRSSEVSHWRTALTRLAAATDHVFGPNYPRTPARAVSLLGDLGVPGRSNAQPRGDRTSGLGDGSETTSSGGGTRTTGAGDGTTGIGGGADAIVTVLGPPFAPPRAEVTAAIDHSRDVLTQPNGGVTPGEDWRTDGVAWTPATALFGLSAAARGDRTTAESVLNWLDANRTKTGAFPEKVNRDNRPAGEAPLAWTSALVILIAAALTTPVPTTPFIGP